MYLLDTDVISQITKPSPHARAMQWLGSVRVDLLYLSVATYMELQIGIELLPPGKRRRGFDFWLRNDLRELYRGRILPVNIEIAELAGEFVARNRGDGVGDETVDALIAATAQVHGFAVATLNRKHFERLGVELVEF